MILDVTNPMQIPSVVRMAGNIPDMPVAKLKKMLIKALTESTAKILVSKKDGIANGFVFATIEGFDGEDVAFVQCCYIHPDAKHAGREMLNMLDKWAQANRLKEIVMITGRDPKAYERKYNFRLASYVMKRSIYHERNV